MWTIRAVNQHASGIPFADALTLGYAKQDGVKRVAVALISHDNGERTGLMHTIHPDDLETLIDALRTLQRHIDDDWEIPAG